MLYQAAVLNKWKPRPLVQPLVLELQPRKASATRTSKIAPNGASKYLPLLEEDRREEDQAVAGQQEMLISSADETQSPDLEAVSKKRRRLSLTAVEDSQLLSMRSGDHVTASRYFQR